LSIELDQNLLANILANHPNREGEEVIKSHQGYLITVFYQPESCTELIKNAMRRSQLKHLALITKKEFSKARRVYFYQVAVSKIEQHIIKMTTDLVGENKEGIDWLLSSH